MKKGVVFSLTAIILAAALWAGCAQAAASPVSPATAPDSTVAVAAQPTAVQPANTSSGQETNSAKSAATVPVSSSPALVKIGDILQNPKAYDGKTVQVQGKIVSECGSGCWFTLKEGNAVIYIDLAPNNMVIPQKRGADARVTAKVVTEGKDVYLIGSKVEF